MSLTINAKGAKLTDNLISVGTSANMRAKYPLQAILDVAQSIADHGYDPSLGPVIVAKLPKPERDSSACVIVPEKIQADITNKGGHQVELNGQKKMVVGLASLASGEEREYGIINGQTRYMACRLLNALGFDVTIPVTVAEYDPAMSARIDNDERLLKGHDRAEALARCVMIRSNDPTMSQADLGRKLGMTLKDRTRLQWLDAASKYAMTYNDHDYVAIDDGAYKAKDLADANGKIDHAAKAKAKEAEASKPEEATSVTFDELTLMGLPDLVAVLKDADKSKRMDYGRRISEALARYK